MLSLVLYGCLAPDVSTISWISRFEINTRQNNRNGPLNHYYDNFDKIINAFIKSLRIFEIFQELSDQKLLFYVANECNFHRSHTSERFMALLSVMHIIISKREDSYDNIVVSLEMINPWENPSGKGDLAVIIQTIFVTVQLVL